MTIKKLTLLMSTDYAKFELCQFNRNVEKTKALEASMKKHGFIPAYPIHVVRDGNRLMIKGGHHRFEMAQKLGIPFYYIICEDEATIHELEDATTKWNQSDYLESFIKCGVEDYRTVKEFHQSTGIALGMCISMMGGESAGSNNRTPEFKRGEFKITEAGREHCLKVGDVVLFCHQLGIPSKNVYFVSALSRCLFVEQFSVEVFKRRAQANVAMFHTCPNVQQQTELFEAVYNRNATTNSRLPLTFLANQAMARRLPTGKRKGEIAK